MAEAKAKPVEGRDILGRDVIDGRVFVDGRWIESEVFDPQNFEVKQSGSNKEESKSAFDSHKEVPECFRKCVEFMIDSLGAAGYNVEFRYKVENGKSASAGIQITRMEDEKLKVATNPLEVATLPRTTPPGKDPQKDFKTAEERDAEERKNPGTVSGKPVVTVPK